MSVVANEIYAWLPTIARAIALGAARRITDRVVRERVAEEWQSAICDLPGHLMQLRHAVSLFFSAPRVEHHWRMQLDDPEFMERVTDIERAIRKFGDKIRQARLSCGVGLDSMSRETRLSMGWLHALEDGNVGALPQGAYIRGWLEQIGQLLQLNGKELRREFDKIGENEGILPPRRPGGRVRLRRCFSHTYESWTVHVGTESIFHWTFAECVECGYATSMFPDVCGCKPTPRPRHKLGMQLGTIRISPSFDTGAWSHCPDDGVPVRPGEFRPWQLESEDQ